ncbi:hypothetical protein AB0M23_26265 [Streptomyces sp. NPDC052077]|uniref:hypothetical protein n=1 Tax=Streptomyces sp. NPDC052077 TaxID=3154757 RepID=UPI003440B4BB
MTTPLDPSVSAARPATPDHAPVGLSSAHLFDGSVIKLKEDCAALGVGTPVPLRVRVALRRRLHLRHGVRKLLNLTLPLMVLLSFAVLLLRAMMPLDETFSRNDHSDAKVVWRGAYYVEGSGPVTTVEGDFFIFFAPPVLIGLYRLTLWWVERQLGFGMARPRVARLLLARRYALVLQCARAIYACEESRRGGERRPARLREVSKRLRVVRRAVLDAHSSRRSVPLFSHRRKRLKLHERNVAAALRELEVKLDRSPDEARREIAEALLIIADRYCQGRVGALLDEGRLDGIPPQRNWEALRYLIALLLAAGGITGLAITGIVPESAESMVYVLVGAMAFVIALGSQFKRALDVYQAIVGAGP